MTADVNVIEKMARAMWASWNPHGPRWHQTDDRSREETRSEARKALGVLADPEVLDGISGVLRDTYARTTCGGDPTAAGEVSDWLPEAAAVVDWLRGERP